MPIKIVPKEDKKTSGNEKMRSAAVREEMMDMMRAGEAPKDSDKIGLIKWAESLIQNIV
jgi:hypothetical protein